jgi:hypothetical protein
MVFLSLGCFERRHLLADDFVCVPGYLWSGSMARDIWSESRDDAGRLLPGIHIDLALVTMAGFQVTLYGRFWVTPRAGQIDMYVRMMDDLKRTPDDNPTVGIILCTQKDASVVRYSVLHENEQLFASRYKLVLPSEEELRRELERERAQLLNISDLEDSTA